MRHWTRAKTDTWCGFCAAVILADTPLLAIETAGRTFTRCEQCAGPADLEQLEAADIRADATAAPTVERRAPTGTRPARPFAGRWRRVGDAAPDPKRRQSGEES